MNDFVNLVLILPEIVLHNYCEYHNERSPKLTRSNKEMQSSWNDELEGLRSPKRQKNSHEPPGTPNNETNHMNRIPQTPDSDFKNFAEAILTPSGPTFDSPLVSFTPYAFGMQVPTSRLFFLNNSSSFMLLISDWSPYPSSSQNQGQMEILGSPENSPLTSYHQLKKKNTMSPYFGGLDESLFDPSTVDPAPLMTSQKRYGTRSGLNDSLLSPGLTTGEESRIKPPLALRPRNGNGARRSGDLFNISDRNISWTTDTLRSLWDEPNDSEGGGRKNNYSDVKEEESESLGSPERPSAHSHSLATIHSPGITVVVLRYMFI
jgi:hypothetical protein